MTGSSTSRGKLIFHLERKIDALGQFLVLSNKMTEPVNRTKIAACICVKRETLNSACTNGTISADIEEAICEAGKFDREEVSWHDPEAALNPSARRDTITHFRDFLSRNAENLRRSARKFACKRPEHKDENLINLDISGPLQSWPNDQPMPIFFDIIVGTGFTPNRLEYGLSQFRLNFSFADCPEALISKTAKETKIGDALLRIEANRFQAHIYVEAPGSKILCGKYTTTEAPVCELANLKLGNSVTAAVSVRPMDGTSIRYADGRPIEDELRSNFLALLQSEKLGEKDTHGWVTLAEQKLTLVEAPSEPRK